MTLTPDTINVAGLPFAASRVALGTWAIGGWMWGGPDDDNAIKTIHAALDLGINLIDTAPVYGFGHSEEVVGRAVEGRRDRVLLATKCGLNWKDGRVFRDSRPERLRQEVEDSLKRLRTDRIDLMQVHWPDPKVAIDDVARTLDDLRREGKILALGASNFSVAQLDQFRAVAPLAAVQPPYNLFERAIDIDVLPYSRAYDLVALAYGPLCRGLLSGRMTAETTFGGDDLRSSDPKFQAPRFAAYLQAVEDLKVIAKRHGKSILALAIRWVLDRGPTIALWGARRPAQISGVDEAFGWSLNPEDFQEIDAILARDIPDPVGPEFMAPPDV